MVVATRTALVYVLRSGDSNYFKIGRSHDLERRLKHLATGNPDRLTLFDSIETNDAALCETYLHHRLRNRRSKSSDAREFFEVDPDDLRRHLQEARAFLDDFIPKLREAELLAGQESDGRILRPGGAEWGWYRGLVDVRQELDGLELERRRLEVELKIKTGRAAGLDGIANWQSGTSARFDQASFRSSHPDLYQLFVVTSRRRNFRLL